MITGYITSTYEITDAYKRISIDARDASVRIEASDNESTKVVLFEDKKRRYGFRVQNDTLALQLQKTRWYNLLRIGFKRSEIRICVPKEILAALSIKASVGSVDISSIDCKGDINIQTTTGKVHIRDISCKALTSKAGTGSILLHNLRATDSASIECNTGRVSLNDCNVPKLFIQTNTGCIYGKLPSNTVFTVKTNTGKIELPDKVSIGEAIRATCEVKTNTGNIRFE